jgi:hypothetical protein
MVAWSFCMLGLGGEVAAGARHRPYSSPAGAAQGTEAPQAISFASQPRQTLSGWESIAEWPGSSA